MHVWVWTLVSLLAVSQARGENFCSPLALQRDKQKVIKIESRDVQSLLWQVRTASPDTTLLLEDGVYTLMPRQSLNINTPRVTIRGASRNREAVVIDGGANNITINADDCIIADITLRNPQFHNIQVRGENGVMRTKIYNVHLVDAGQQFVKVSAGDGLGGKFADDGLVACSLVEYTTYSCGTEVSPPSYTNGVTILAGKGWVVRDNEFRRIRSKDGPAGPTVLAWKNAIGTVVRRNLVIDSWRGIVLGLAPPDKYSRGGPQAEYDHQEGLVENNVILALNEPADAAIENNFALNSRIFHNTVYYKGTNAHAVNWSIEYRFPQTTAIIKNNLVNLPIIKRAPAPIQDAIVEGNVTNAIEDWFQDLTSGDAHLVKSAPAIDKGVSFNSTDLDGEERPFGLAPDAGADEFTQRDHNRREN